LENRRRRRQQSALRRAQLHCGNPLPAPAGLHQTRLRARAFRRKNRAQRRRQSGPGAGSAGLCLAGRAPCAGSGALCMNAFPKTERPQGGWLQGALARAEQLDDWLSPERRQSLAQLRETPWPNRKTEAWQYTPLTALERSEFSGPAQDAPSIDTIEGLNSI